MDGINSGILLDNILRWRQWQVRIQGSDNYIGNANLTQLLDILLAEFGASGKVAGARTVINALGGYHAILEAGDW